MFFKKQLPPPPPEKILDSFLFVLSLVKNIVIHLVKVYMTCFKSTLSTDLAACKNCDFCQENEREAKRVCVVLEHEEPSHTREDLPSG